jgi:uncharacterized protein YnzC (UPF0291/DUF896 family)
MTKQTYKEYQEALKAEQEGLSREELAEQLKKRSEYVLDLDNIKPQKHRWVDRGHVVSCEGGDHPPHRAFKRIRT